MHTVTVTVSLTYRSNSNVRTSSPWLLQYATFVVSTILTQIQLGIMCFTQLQQPPNVSRFWTFRRLRHFTAEDASTCCSQGSSDKFTCVWFQTALNQFVVDHAPIDRPTCGTLTSRRHPVGGTYPRTCTRFNGHLSDTSGFVAMTTHTYVSLIHCKCV